MNRFTGLIVVVIFGFALAWAQTPAPQNGGTVASPAQTATPAQTTSTPETAVNGCMTQWFGQFKVADTASSKSWDVKGGANLWSNENHVVKVQGLPDPKAATPTIYAQNVQDTGQTCGNGATSAAAQPGAPPATVGNNATTGAAAGSAGNTSPNGPAPGTAQPEQRPQPGGGVASSTAPTSPVTPQTQQPATPQATSPQQGGMSGAASGTSTSPQSENKGTPQAGSPQGAVASNAAQPADSNQIFNGCLGGAVNNYQFKGTNGKIYRLQGNTMGLDAMVNHNVEITGEDFNGKAIQVNGARDLGGSCKAK